LAPEKVFSKVVGLAFSASKALTGVRGLFNKAWENTKDLPSPEGANRMAVSMAYLGVANALL
jgi:uncharacterized BrkB/YihY/UPF0761 family membrane protein